MSDSNRERRYRDVTPDTSTGRTVQAARVILSVLLIAGAGCRADDPVTAAGPAGSLETAPQIALEPTYSPGTANTVHWTYLPPNGTPPNARFEFQVQQAVDDEFRVHRVESPWIPASSYEFSDLIHRLRYRYRVRARMAAGAVSEFSVTTTSIQDSSSPRAEVSPLEPNQTSLRFEIAVAAQDEGSGIQHVELWVAAPDSVPRLVSLEDPGTISFNAAGPGQHGFYAVAVDRAGNRQTTPTEVQAVTDVPTPIIITDIQGEDFDITHAVLRYGMHEVFWDHGLGRFSILPIIDPTMVGPEDPRYPDENNLADVMGVSIDGDARAYKVGHMSSREAVNDVVAGVHLAATY